MSITKHAFLAVILIFATQSYADGGFNSSSSGNTTKPLPESIPPMIESEDYSGAISALEEFISEEDKNPDAWNLLAFSQRNIGLYDESLSSYKKALNLDRKHIGAHEYIGELYLALKNPKNAKKHLKKLKKYCGTDCEEYQELSELIKQYESES